MLIDGTSDAWSAQDLVRGRFTQENAVVDLEDLMNQIFVRRAVQRCTFRKSSRRWLLSQSIVSECSIFDRASSFRVHPRYAHDANAKLGQGPRKPDVPLHKLGKSVPHGRKDMIS